MGMAASQARLLSITTRLSDNELRSQLINNAKMRLATESSSVSEAYINALNDTTYMFTNYDSDNNTTYSTLTFNSLTSYNEFNTQYGLSNAAGQILVSETDGANFDKSSNLEAFLACYGLEYKTTYFDTLKDTYGDDTYLTVYDDEYTQYSSLFTVSELEKFYTVYYDSVLISSDFNEYLQLEETYIDAKEAYQNAITSYSTELVNGFTGTNIKGNSDTYDLETLQTQISSLESETYVSNTVTDAADYLMNMVYALSDLLGYNNTKTSSLYYAVFGKTSTTRTDIFPSKSNASEEYDIEYDGSYYYIYVDDNLAIRCDDASGTNAALYYYNGTQWVAYNTTNAANSDYVDDNNALLYELDSSGVLTYYNCTESNGVMSVDQSSPYYQVNFSTILSNLSNYMETDTEGSFNLNYSSMSNSAYCEYYTDLIEEYYARFNEIYAEYIAKSSYIDTLIATSSTYSSYYNDYVDASMAMEDYIFGKKGVLDFEQYQYLDDYRALLLSMEYTTSDQSDTLNCQYVDTGLNYSGTTYSDTTYSDTTYASLLAALKNGSLTINGETITSAYLNVIKVYEMETVMSIYGEPSCSYIKDGDEDSNGDAEAEWYTNLYERMCEGYMVLEDGLASSAEWIQYALESGLVKLEQVDSDGEWNSITYTSCSDITETTDDTAVTVAEAEYTKAMNKIEAKDKVYDLELKNIDTEHSALETEYDSIKNAMDKNIERNFKLYS